MPPRRPDEEDPFAAYGDAPADFGPPEADPFAAYAEPEGPSLLEKGKAFGTAAARAVPFTDELKAKLQSLSGPETYEQELAKVQAEDAASLAKAPGYGTAGTVAGSLALGAVTPGLGVARTVGGALARGAGIGAAEGSVAGAGEAQPGLVNRAVGAVKGAATGAGFGAFGGAAGYGLQKLAGAFAAAGRPVIDRLGRLTAEARDFLARGGVDPDSIPPDSVARLAETMAGSKVAPETLAPAARSVMGEEALGVRPTLGQATQDKNQLGRELEMRSGTKGPEAARIMEEGAAAQAQGVERGVENIVNRVGPRAALGVREGGAGADVAGAVNRAAAREYANVGRMYEAANQGIKSGQFMLGPQAADDLLPRIQKGFVAANREFVDPSRAPGAGEALKLIESRLQGKAVDPRSVEEVRKRIGEIRRETSDPTDKGQLNSIIKSFDGWFDDAMERAIPAARPANALGGAPSPTGRDALQGIKDARAAAKRYFGRFEAEGSRDEAGKLVERIRDGSVKGQALFDDLMGGRTGFDAESLPRVQRVREIIGPDSAEWDGLRRGMLRRIVLGDANKQAAGDIGPQMIQRRIAEALEGRGEELTRAALGDDAVAQLRQLRTAVGDLVPPRGVLNTSNTDYSRQRRSRDLVNKSLAALGATVGVGGGFLGGGPGGALAGATAGYVAGQAAEAGLDRLGARAARRAVAGYAPPRTFGRAAAETAAGMFGGGRGPAMSALLGAGLIPGEPGTAGPPPMGPGLIPPEDEPRRRGLF